jgi:hypothetical protein
MQIMDPRNDQATPPRPAKPAPRRKQVMMRYARKRLNALRIAWNADEHFRSLTARGVRHDKARDQVLMFLAEQNSASDFDGSGAGRMRRLVDVRAACQSQHDRIRELDRVLLAELLPRDEPAVASRFTGIAKAVLVALAISLLTTMIASDPRGGSPPPQFSDQHQR